MSTSLEWKLNPNVFQRVCQIWGQPDTDLFASRVSHQLERYFSWTQDPNCIAVDAFYQNWEPLFPYAFPPFCLITKVLRQAKVQAVREMVLITPLWPSQPWYPFLLSMAISPPRILPSFPLLLENPTEEGIHPLLQNSSLSLVAWMVSGIDWKPREFRERLQNLILKSQRSGTTKNYESAWKRWTLWCGGRSVDPVTCSLKHVLDYLAQLFAEGKEYRTIGVHRSALSAYHAPIEGSPVGQHPKISD